MEKNKIRMAKLNIYITEDVGKVSNEIRTILLESNLKTTYSEMFKTAFEEAGIKNVARVIAERRREE